MKKLESLNSKLFKEEIIPDKSLTVLKGGYITNTFHKSGVTDTSNSNDGDLCWSLGNKDKESDCNVMPPEGDPTPSY